MNELSVAPSIEAGQLLPNPKFTKTRPWLEEEFLLLNGHKVVYSGGKHPESMVIRLPGGYNYTLSQLKEKGYQIVMPGKLRTNDFA